MIVYVSIGNSDDKLTQRQWSEFTGRVHMLLIGQARTIHGAWHSRPDDPWQNACWCAELGDRHRTEVIKSRLADWAAYYGQDSIAWAEAPKTEFIPPNADVESAQP